MKRKIENIYLDMDEVLADFIGGACKCWEVPRLKMEKHRPNGHWEIITALGKCDSVQKTHPYFSTRTFWERINSKSNFWKELEPLPWGLDMVNLVKSTGINVSIVSTPVPTPSCYGGKIKWLYDHFGQFNLELILIQNKSRLNNTSSILIDDKESNLISYNERGIIYPSKGNSLWEQADNPYSYVFERLNSLL